MDLLLRPVIERDVAIFWKHQQENRPEAGTSAHHEAFAARWKSVLDNPGWPIRTIVAGGQVAGYIAHFHRKDVPEVSYELGRAHWGQGLATEALRQLLCEIVMRPLFARAAKDNPGSIRVLQKCGFTIIAEGRFTDDSQREHEEFIFELR